MKARGEDTLDSVACDDGVEDGPDSIIRGGDGVDIRSKVTRRTRLEDLEVRVVRSV